MKSGWLWAIVGAALAARLALLAPAWNNPLRAMTPDSFDYERLARALIERGEFAGRDVEMYPFLSGPEVFRTPGYPAWLAAWEWICGPFGRSFRGALGGQVILDGLLVVLTFVLGRRLAGQRAGLLAALFQAISPLAVASSCRILSDSIFALLVTAGLLLTLRCLRARAGSSAWWIVAAGAVIALACYVRAAGLATACLCAAILVLAGDGRARRNWGRGLLRGGLFAAVFLTIIAPWVIRNALAAGYWGFSSFATDSLYKFSLPRIIAEEQGFGESGAGQFLQEQREEYVKRHPQAGAADMVRYRARYAWATIRRYPWTSLRVHLNGSLGFWLPGVPDLLEVAGLSTGQRGTLAVFQEQGLWTATRHYFGGNAPAIALAVPLVLIFIVKFLGVIACVVRRFRLRLPAEVWLMVLLVAVAALLPGPAAHPRFRVPVEPILSIAAAVGWLALIRRRPKTEGPEPNPTHR